MGLDVPKHMRQPPSYQLSLPSGLSMLCHQALNTIQAPETGPGVEYLQLRWCAVQRVGLVVPRRMPQLPSYQLSLPSGASVSVCTQLLGAMLLSEQQLALIRR